MQQIATISVKKNFLRVTPLKTDTAPLVYNTMFIDRSTNDSIYSTFINTPTTLKGTRNLTHQDIQTPSHFVNKGIVETLHTTTQQINSLINTTTHNKTITAFSQTTL